jgi:hypothetical protein
MFNKKRAFRGFKAGDDVRPFDIKTAVSRPVFSADDATSWIMGITALIGACIPILVTAGPQLYAAALGH